VSAELVGAAWLVAHAAPELADVIVGNTDSEVAQFLHGLLGALVIGKPYDTDPQRNRASDRLEVVGAGASVTAGPSGDGRVLIGFSGAW
jgi:hypothetical protein